MHALAAELVHDLLVPLLIGDLRELSLVKKRTMLVEQLVALLYGPNVGRPEFLVESLGLVLLKVVFVVFSEQIQSPRLPFVLLDQLHHHKGIQVFIDSGRALLHF